MKFYFYNTLQQENINMYIDSHCHIDLINSSYININNILQNATSFQISKIVQVSASLKDFNDYFSKFLSIIYDKEFEKKIPKIYFTFGASPNDLCEENFSFEKLLRFFNSISFNDKNLNDYIKEKKIIAIGEIGLDYFHKFFDKKEQIASFENQLNLSNLVQLPVMLHIRDAFDDAIDILRNFNLKKQIIFHCFSGDKKVAEKILETFDNCYFSFAGNVTYKKMEFLRESLVILPEEKLLVETDSPFLAPIPYRGKDNMPWYIIETYKFMANLLKIDLSAFTQLINRNFEKAYNL